MELLIVSLTHENVETESLLLLIVWKRLLVDDIQTPTIKPEATCRMIFLRQISTSFRVHNTSVLSPSAQRTLFLIMIKDTTIATTRLTFKRLSRPLKTGKHLLSAPTSGAPFYQTWQVDLL